jgi:hypothetical protein
MSRFVTLAARRALPAASATLLVALGACSDTITAPASRMAASRAPNADIVVSGAPRTIGVWVTLQVGDQGWYGDYGAPGTTVEFTTNAGAKSTVVDNSAADTDARDGYYRVLMPNAISYTATVTVVPEHNSLGGATKTVSAFVTPTLVSMGAIYLNRKPGLFVQLFYNNALVAGQTIKVTGPNGWTTTITDGGASDKTYDGTQNGADGKISLEVPITGTYTVCTMTSPQLYWDAGCNQVYATQYFVQYGVTMTYKQVWFVPKF